MSVICTKKYRSTFNCTKEEWSKSNSVSQDCSIAEDKDWHLVSNCEAEKWIICEETLCAQIPDPSPPQFQPQECCNKCVWLFKKEFNCITKQWDCIQSTLSCGAGITSDDWQINGCEATYMVVLDILCIDSADCPTPDCTKAPPGPFTKPVEECCTVGFSAEGTDNTVCEPCPGNCRFLGCSVVGFNGSIGWNTQESMVNIDLVEVQCDIDGTGNPSEVFTGANLIGYPVYFSCGSFFFGGLLQNWTYSSNSGGRTYNVKVIDPRQILEQCTLIIDTYAGPPVKTLNYFNVYGFYEEEVYLNKDCSKFGDATSGGGKGTPVSGPRGSSPPSNAGVTERGMPYVKIINALKNMNPTICTPVGANLTIDWSTFDIPVPEYFKIAGPSITLLQLIADICDEAGYDFFVTLEPGDIVRIYPVSLKKYDPIEDNLFFGFNNVIDFTYGKELRITKTRNLLFGEQQHYLDVVYWGEQEGSREAEVQYVFNGVTGEKQYSLALPGDNTDPFEFYFGEEINPETGLGEPIIPYKREFGQFWVDIDIRKLNINLIIPFNIDRINICEYDIRTAMTSFESFWSWVGHEETPSELGQEMQSIWPIKYNPKGILTRLNQSSVTLAYALADAAGIPNSDRASANLHSWPPVLEDVKKVHEWIAEFGRTYYGRQYLVKLNEKVCVKGHPEDFGEQLYTDTPTNDGGWVEPGIPVMGLQDPDLGLFRTDDDRVGPFALFCNPDIMSDILKYSGSGGGEYEYTLGSGVLDISQPPPPENGI